MWTSKRVTGTAHPGSRRTALFVLLLVFLNLQLDGFRLAADPETNQRLLLPFTIFFCVCLLLLLRRRAADSVATPGLHTPETSPRLLHGLALASLLPTLALFFASVRHYAQFGYELHRPAVLLVFAAAAVSVGLCFLLKRPATPLFAAALLSYLALSLLSFWSFPLSLQRSDMLPLLGAADKVLLHGGSPYRLYTFPSESLYLTYLPGTVLAFLPASLLHVDPRLLNCVWVGLLAVMLYRSIAHRHRYIVAALLALWLLSPYLLYRHELYTEPHWLALIASLLLLSRGRILPGAVVFGISISLSQFSWILFPFYLLYCLQRFGWGPAVRAALLGLLTAAILTLPFLLWSPHAFVFGVLSHWQTQTVVARPVNASFWLAKLIGAPHLQRVQAALLAALLLACALRRSCRTFAGMLRAMSLALAGFLLCNILIWGYFFLLLELLLLLYVCAANGWLTSSFERAPTPEPTGAPSDPSSPSRPLRN